MNRDRIRRRSAAAPCALAYLGSFLVACQAVSGLDQLRFVVADGGTARMTSDIEAEDAGCAAPECKPGASCRDARPADCLRSCDFASEAQCAAGTRCAHLEDLGGDYCVAPTASCETDGHCDEPAWGTRRCVADSDPVDCACSPRVADASCDLVAQCGCRSGTHCALLAVRVSRASVGCSPNVAPLREPAATCNAETECPAGYSCWRGLCEKYCATDVDCQGSRCMALRDANEISGVKVCAVACDFDSNTGCKPGTQCVRAPSGETYCLVPRDPCPYVNDGVCDEPQGSRICVAGTDAVDCR
jgi:hypothetical protein